jgi:hypothetical protein
LLHGMLQPPQCWSLLRGFTQMPPQRMSTPLQSSGAVPHLPLVQGPPLHDTRQPPQLFGSLFGFTQAPLHVIWPTGQAATQAPSRQTRPLAPQLVLLVAWVHRHCVAAVHERQGPVAQVVAQQCPSTHAFEAHSVESKQAAPLAFFAQVPPKHVRPSPQPVPLAVSRHCHWVAAVHERQGPVTQALPQQRLFTQAFDWHSVPSRQTSPRAFLAGATQRLSVQVWPAGQAAALAVQAPAALQV